MFFVLNKNKINSYLVSLGTVIMLLTVSMFTNNKIDSTVETSTGSMNFNPIYKVETETKKVAISINCSENVENIESILNTLSKMKINATFFVTGEVAVHNSDIIKKIINNGNEIGNLSYHYTNLKNKKTEEITEEISKCTEEIEKIINTKIKIFRAPYGECNNEITQIANKQNLFVTQWNIDSLDYNGLNSGEMCKRINEGLMPGSIILFHNTGKYTANSLEDIIQNIQKQKYEICTVSNLIKLETKVN